MFGFRAFGSHSHSHSPSSCPVGVAIQNLLTQLQEELTRREETYEDVIRDHQAIELLSSISEKLSLVGNGEDKGQRESTRPVITIRAEALIHLDLSLFIILFYSCVCQRVS